MELNVNGKKKTESARKLGRRFTNGDVSNLNLLQHEIRPMPLCREIRSFSKIPVITFPTPHLSLVLVSHIGHTIS